MSIFRLFILRHGQSELNHENIFCGWIDAQLTDKGKKQAAHASQLIKNHCDAHGLKLPEIGYTSRLVRTQQTMDVILEGLEMKANPQIVVSSFENLDLPSVDQMKTNYECREIPVLQTWRLNERHYGSWQGQRKPTIMQEYGKEKFMYIRRDYNGKPPVVDLNREMIQTANEIGAATGYEFKEPNRKQKYAPEEANKSICLPDSESLADVVTRLETFVEKIILKFSKDWGQDSCLIVGHGSSVRSLLKILENISNNDIKNVDIPNGIPLVIELDKTHNFKFIRKFYLDPENAKIDAEKVRNEGFQK